MVRTPVKTLLCSIIFLAIVVEILGPPSPPRDRPTRTRSSGPFQRLRTGWSGMVRTFTPRYRGINTIMANDHEASGSGTKRGNDDGASGSGRRSRSRSNSPDVQIIPPPTPRSRSRSSSPDVQIIPPPPPRPPGPRQPPFPFIVARITANNPNELELINRFAQIHTLQGDPDMTLQDFKAKKTSLLQKLNEDNCHTDKRSGGNKCALALKEFKEITAKWRGPCGNAFMGICQPWGTAGWRCSWLMKTSSGYNPPITGYSHTMQDCVNALSPEEFERALNAEVDDYFA